MRVYLTGLLLSMRRRRLLRHLDGSGEKIMGTAPCLTEEGTTRMREINIQ